MLSPVHLRYNWSLGMTRVLWQLPTFLKSPHIYIYFPFNLKSSDNEKATVSVLPFYVSKVAGCSTFFFFFFSCRASRTNSVLYGNNWNRRRCSEKAAEDGNTHTRARAIKSETGAPGGRETVPNSAAHDLPHALFPLDLMSWSSTLRRFVSNLWQNAHADMH